MLHPFVALVWGMGASILAFYAAFYFRLNNAVHKRLAISGVILNLMSSIYLIYAVRIIGVEMPSRFGVEVQLAHRIFATAMAIVMLTMLVTGLKRVRRLHLALHRYFLLGYTLTYASGLVIFHG